MELSRRCNLANINSFPDSPLETLYNHRGVINNWVKAKITLISSKFISKAENPNIITQGGIPKGSIILHRPSKNSLHQRQLCHPK